MEKNSNFYSVLVAGDVDLSKYDKNKVVEPYVAYKYEDRHDIRQKTIDLHKLVIENLGTTENLAYHISCCILEHIEDMTDEEYFEHLTKGMTYDKLTGDALSTINPNGKYRCLKEANPQWIPIHDNSFECTVEDLLKNSINNKDLQTYADSYDMYVQNGGNMFKNQDEFINYQISFSCNAFVSEETGWLEQIDEDQVQWGINFMDRFIKNLPRDTKLKLMEYIP